MAVYDYDRKLYTNVLHRAVGREPITHFAARAHVAAGNFCRIYHGQRATPDTLAKIASASEYVTYAELMLAAGYVSSEEAENIPDCPAEVPKTPKTGRVVEIPTVHDFPKYKSQIREDPTATWEKYYDDAFGDGDYIFFIASDDALAPRVNQGESVLVDLEMKPADGDVALLRFKGQPAILRRIVQKNKSYLLYGNDTTKYPMTEVKINKVEIIGKAIRGFVGL